jgi:ubiquinone/menaquinone biosynthesis C-methylase UbiE
VTQLAASKADQGRIWGSASWQQIAERQLFPVHDELVARLGPRPGERWLDLATGTGAVALRAARAGASVTGQDLAPELIETARDLAAKDGLGIDFEVGDAERLAYPDASFDVVSSAHGVVHAYDHRAVAKELARVCRPGGRLGLTYWLPNPELQALMERVGYARPPGADLPGDWVRPDYATGLLGEAFELEFAEAVCPWTGKSGAAMWGLLIDSDGPACEGVTGLSAAERDALRRDWVDYFERHRTPGGISAPRPYLLILGRRRTA